MDADPTVRLMTVLDAVAARADEARDRLDALTARVGSAASPSRPDPADPVRLTAIELAVAGSDREQTAIVLRERYPDSDLEAVLDDVFGYG
jgi:hypothetical protein